jgi:hypothetical protein
MAMAMQRVVIAVPRAAPVDIAQHPAPQAASRTKKRHANCGFC